MRAASSGPPRLCACPEGHERRLHNRAGERQDEIIFWIGPHSLAVEFCPAQSIAMAVDTVSLRYSGSAGREKAGWVGRLLPVRQTRSRREPLALEPCA